MSAPLSPAYRAIMRRHVAALRRAGYTWEATAAAAGLDVGTVRRMADNGPFARVTRIEASGAATVLRTDDLRTGRRA